MSQQSEKIYQIFLKNKSVQTDSRKVKKGDIFFFTARAAAVPAACPITMQGPLTLVDAKAPCVVEMQRPATSKPSITLGIRQR